MLSHTLAFFGRPFAEQKGLTKGRSLLMALLRKDHPELPPVGSTFTQTFAEQNV